MEQLAVILSIGLFNGLIIALVAIGYTLVYGVIELINFAHGDVLMIGTMLTFIGLTQIVPAVGASPTLVSALALLPFVMIATAGLNAAIERFAYRRLRAVSRLAPLISAIGVSFILQNVGILVLGASPRALPALLPSDTIVRLPGGGSLVTQSQLLVAGITLPLLGLLWLWVQRTRQGKAMRATAQDVEAASAMGIDVNRTVAITFVVGGALAGAAGFVVALYFGQTWWFIGFPFGLLAFTSAVLGGIGNITGAAVGGIALGLVKALSDFYLDARWTSVIVFAILIAVIVVRPTGLFGAKPAEAT